MSLDFFATAVDGVDLRNYIFNLYCGSVCRHRKFFLTPATYYVATPPNSIQIERSFFRSTILHETHVINISTTTAVAILRGEIYYLELEVLNRLFPGSIGHNTFCTVIVVDSYDEAPVHWFLCVWQMGNQVRFGIVASASRQAFIWVRTSP